MHMLILLFYLVLSNNEKRNIVTTNISNDVGHLVHKVHPVYLEFHSGNIGWTLALSAAPV